MTFVQWSVACSVSCLAEKMKSKSRPCSEVATAQTFSSSFASPGRLVDTEAQLPVLVDLSSSRQAKAKADQSQSRFGHRAEVVAG